MLASTLLPFLTLLAPLVKASPLAIAPRFESSPNPIDIPFLTARTNGDDADPEGTLYPSEPWNHDRTNLENLRPTDNHKLYYTDSGEVDLSVKHIFATLDATYRYPAVALSHSSYIDTLECIGTSEDRGIKLKLTDPKAYKFLQETWSGPFEMPKRSLEHELDLQSRNNGNTDPAKMFVLVTHTLGCSAASKSGQNTFWLVKSVWFEDPNCLEVTICVEEIAIEHCVDEIEVIWGTHEPIKNDPGSTGPPGGNNSGGNNPGNNGNNPGDNGGNPNNNGGNPNNNGNNPGGNNNPGNNGGNPDNNGNNPGGNKPDADCGNIPGDTYLGFPTAPCGETFDVQLDNKIGFYDFDDASLATFAPGVDPGPFGDYSDENTAIPDDTTVSDGTTISRRALHSLSKRGFFSKLKKFVKKAVQVVVKKVASVINEIRGVANQIKQAAVKVSQLVKKIYDTLQNLGGDYSKTWSFFQGPARKDPSPWGNQTLILHRGDQTEDANSYGAYDLSAYCVDCGIGARANVFGTARFALFPVPTPKAVYVQVNGSFLAQLNIGVAASAEYTAQESINLFRAPIPGTSVTIPGVFIFGGQASLDVAAYVTARAQGQFLIGASASIPNFNARLDLNPAKTGFSGFKPIFKTRREASGSIDIDLGLGLPLEIGFGISLPAVPSFGSKVLGIRNSPFLVANARGNFTSSFRAGPRCDIPYSLNFVNKIDADLFGSIKPLYKFEKNGLAKGCINLPRGSKRAEYHTIDPRQYDDADLDTSDSTDPVTGPIAGYLDNDSGLVAQTNAELLTIYDQVVAANGSAPVDLDGFKYTTIQDDLDTYSILGDEMGVLRFADKDEAKSLPWAVFEGLVESDAQDRVLHYYPSQMDAFGVSRFRIANTTNLPVSSSLVTLFPVDDDNAANTAPIYVPINTDAKPFFPVMCNFVGQDLPKFFLSKTEDFSALLRKDLRFILTGGVVEKCGIVSLTSAEGTVY